MIKVTGKLIEVDGSPLVSEDVTFLLVDNRGYAEMATVSGEVIATTSTVKTEVNGSFEIDLYPNDMIPKPTKYRVLIKNTKQFFIFLDSASTTVDISELGGDIPIDQIPQNTSGDEGKVLTAGALEGERSWESLPAAATGGDMLASTYDADGDGVVDNAQTVNGKEVELNVLNTGVSSLEASDDFDNA